MNHAITVGGLLCSLVIIAGLVAAAFGTLMSFAAGMSDAADDGTGGKGCIVALAGLALLIGGVVGLIA